MYILTVKFGTLVSNERIQNLTKSERFPQRRIENIKCKLDWLDFNYFGLNVLMSHDNLSN